MVKNYEMEVLMKRLLLLIIIFFICGVYFLSTQAIPQDIPENITINNKGYRRKANNPVLFPHLAHSEDYGIECRECHHEYKGGKNVWEEGDLVKRCIICHSPTKRQGHVLRLVFAYHFNCRGCHKEMESGPVECRDCHKK